MMTDERNRANQGEGTERGSALVISLLVTTILSLLGMSFLLLADTENKISLNDLDSLQPYYVADAGLQVVQSWFDLPNPGRNAMLPAANQVNLSLRRGDVTGDGVDDAWVDASKGNIYTGGNASGSARLFDKPYRSNLAFTFWGHRETPDLLIDEHSASVGAESYLDRLNQLFYGPQDLRGAAFRISEIRLYAPPISLPDGTRLGVATVEVTAQKRVGDRVVGEKVLTAVLQEIPYPGPYGSIESEGVIEQSGSIGTHWGSVSSEDDLYEPPLNSANAPPSSIPRADSTHHGYGNFNPAAADLSTVVGTQNLLTELLGISVLGAAPAKSPGPARIEDAWVRLLSAGQILTGNSPAPGGQQPWPWSISTVNLQNQEDNSHQFQRVNVQFPTLLYDSWKDTAQSGRRHVHYLTFAGMAGADPLFQEGGTGTKRKFIDIVNSMLPGVDPGLFFFDTANRQNPQDGGPGVLTPEVVMNSSGVPGGTDFLIQGIVYLNAAALSSEGIAGKAVEIDAQMPGEPFLDSGVDLDGDGTLDPETIGNGVWDVDLDNDGDSDAADLSVATFSGHDGWSPGTLPHGGGDCRFQNFQPHEPFLNLRYPQRTSGDFSTYVDFTGDNTNPRPVEDVNGDGTYSAGTDRFTSTARDRDGAMFRIRTNMHGIFYNEGSYSGTGNFKGYGSFLMREAFTGTGSIDLYFDERILKSVWPPEEFELPRVKISAVATD